MNKKIYPLLYAIAMAATIYYNGLNDMIAKYVSMAIIGLLFVVALFKALNSQKTPRVFKSWLFWLLLAFFVNLLYGMNQFSYEQLFNISIAMPLMAAFSAYYTFDIKREKLPLFMLPICVFAAYCAVVSVFTGLGGFVIAEHYDDDIAKNQIGAAFATISIISAVFALENKHFAVKIVYWIISVVCMYPSLFFTCRTALLSYLVVIAFLLIGEYGMKHFWKLIPVIAIILIIGGDTINDLLYNSIVGNRDVSDYDDLTSGRFKQARISMDYFLGHPFLGYYGSGPDAGTMPPAAHIFLLFRLTNWGIIGAIPAIVLYFSVFKIFIKSVKTRDLLMAGILFLAFLESFSEFAPPFGPGSCFIIAFIFIGYYLRQNAEVPRK